MVNTLKYRRGSQRVKLTLNLNNLICKWDTEFKEYFQSFNPLSKRW